MAINPPSDIVLEVARAADPTRAAAVAQKLGALAASGSSSPTDFAAALNAAGGAAGASAAPGLANMRSRLADAKLAASEKAGKAEVQFESVLLNNFISEMLPKDAPETYGKGTAGEMWRSMLSEKISDEIAKSGALGISRRLFEGRPISAASALTHAARPDASGHVGASAMSANDLSLPSGAQVTDGAYLFSRGKPT